MKTKSLLKQAPILLLSALLLLVVAQPALGSDAVTLSVGSASGSVGDTVSVDIKIVNATGTAGGYIDLGWWFIGDPDPLKLKLVSVSKGAFVANAADSQFEEGDVGDLGGGLVIKWETPALDTADSGVVATITYELLEAGETELIFDESTTTVDAPPGRQYGAPINGKITASISPDDDKQRAIDLANEAIANLPHASMITLNNKDDVENARYLVGRAKTEHGARDSDFEKLDWLVAAEKAIAALEKPDPEPDPDPEDKARAIELANEAIAALPDPAAITLADREEVMDARYLVGRAKTEHGAVDSDFDNLAKLEAAELRIKELEAGESPGLPTWVYFVFGGLVVVVIILVVVIVSKRS